MNRRIKQLFAAFRLWKEKKKSVNEALLGAIKPHAKYLADCGHETEIIGTISKFGKETEISLIRKENGNFGTCVQCLADATIACAWCGEPILPDRPITLYSTSDSEFKPHEGSVIYEDDENSGVTRYVGCLRWECADSGADRQGFWVLPGKVERCISPIEQALHTGDMVIVEDLSDRNEAVQVPEVLTPSKN
jgi:hypothetical protein